MAEVLLLILRQVRDSLLKHCVTMAELISCGVITHSTKFKIGLSNLLFFFKLVPTLFFTGTLSDTLSPYECSDHLPQLPLPSTVRVVNDDSGDISYEYCEAVTARGTFRSDSVTMEERGKSLVTLYEILHRYILTGRALTDCQWVMIF